MAETRDTAAVAQRFAQSLSQNQTDVFNRVVTVDLQIAFGFDLQIEMAVPRELSQHVIEKRNAGRDAMVARAIEIQADPDIGFIRLSRFGGFSSVH
jgi:hypothetical protein